jgi:drug/metabolite transporter (DMT)-like permease
VKAHNLLALILLAAIWGSSFPFIKLGLDSFAPATIVALRLLGGALILTSVLYLQGHRLPTTPRAWRDMVLVGCVGMVSPFLLITWGEQYINSGLAAILVATTPLFTLLLAALWTHEERLSLGQTSGVLLGFTGVAVAMNVLHLDPTSGSTQGRFAVLGAAFCYGIVAIYGRRAFRGMPALVPATGTMIGGALCITPLALLLDGLPTLAPSRQALVGVAGLALLSTAMAYILYYWILARLGSARTTMVTYLIPLFALLFGWLWLNEPVGTHTLPGLTLVLLGIMIANGVPFWKGRAAAPAAGS